MSDPERVVGALAELVEQFSSDVADDAQRCRNLLRDAAPHDRLHVKVLVDAVEAGIAAELRDSSVALSLLVPRCVQRLQAQQGLSEANARFAVETWGRVLRPHERLDAGATNLPVKSVDPARCEERTASGGPCPNPPVTGGRCAVHQPEQDNDSPGHTTSGGRIGAVLGAAENRPFVPVSVAAVAPLVALLVGSLAWGPPRWNELAIFLGFCGVPIGAFALHRARKHGAATSAAALVGLACLGLVIWVVWDLVDDFDYLRRWPSELAIGVLFALMFAAAALANAAIALLSWRPRSRGASAEAAPGSPPPRMSED